MQAVIGQHQVGSELAHDRSNITAVLECGCEVPMSAVKFPANVAKCPAGHEAKVEAAKAEVVKQDQQQH